ncbi:MAG: aminotransferase DegT [Coxiella sp. (in: Bacteria)]|nr:MAG: aminotransferase DegT [Coxiella sp. (in: g-proteobacteria)]
MKYIDLNHQYKRIKPAVDAAIQRVLDHGQFIMGPEITEFEQVLADYVGAEQAIAVSSGTTALQIALMALEIQPGDEVITTPFSFFATAEVIYLLGAKPIYVDIDPRTYNLDPEALACAITDKTKAIIPVSLYGQCADMDAINDVANQHGIAVIEDAAQSFGATYKGRKSCALSTIACASFFPSKPLGAYGDAGACFTNDAALAERMRSILNHGQNGRYHHELIGINGRCDTLQAAILLQKMTVFDEELALREQVAAWYGDALGAERAPFIADYNQSAWAQYTIEVDGREQVQAALAELNIPTAVHYPKGLHQQPIIASLETDVLSFPKTESAGQRVMSVPFHPYMTQTDVRCVVESIDKVMSKVCSQ